MGISLNQIVSLLSDEVGQPFNVNLQNKLKDIVIYKRANFTQQFLSKNPYQRNLFMQAFNVEVEEIEETDCDVPLECSWYRSVCELPDPIRSNFAIWDFVGTADYTHAFGYLKPEFVQFQTSARYTSEKPKWFWQNNRLIILNSGDLESVGVRGIPADPRSINTCACKEQDCFDDDSPFPIAEDLLNSIVRDTLNVELRNIFPQPAIVQVDKEEAQVVKSGE